MIGQPSYILDMIDSFEKNWYYLCANPNAIHLLEQIRKKKKWSYRSRSKSFWKGLSFNPNAIHLLEQNMDKVEWELLSENPNAIHILFPFDYEKMKEANKTFAEELASYVFHPERMMMLSEVYNVDFMDLLGSY